MAWRGDGERARSKQHPRCNVGVWLQEFSRVSRAGADEIATRLGLGDIGDNVRRANFAEVRVGRPSPDLAMTHQ
jgi:hypothetical protein